MEVAKEAGFRLLPSWNQHYSFRRSTFIQSLYSHQICILLADSLRFYALSLLFTMTIVIEINVQQIADPLQDLSIHDQISPAAFDPNAPESSNAQYEGDGHSIYIKNLPLNVTVTQLGAEFKKFGPIKKGGVPVRSNKGFCSGFVEFKDLNSMHNAIQRVLEDRVPNLLEKLLDKPSLVSPPTVEEGGLLLYLRMLAVAYEKTQVLARDLRGVGCGELDVEGLTESLFLPHKDIYIEYEQASLIQLYKAKMEELRAESQPSSESTGTI